MVSIRKERWRDSVFSIYKTRLELDYLGTDPGFILFYLYDLGQVTYPVCVWVSLLM